MNRCLIPYASILVLLGAGCSNRDAAPVGPLPPTPVALGDPLPGLTPAELSAFQRGKVLFEKRFKPSEGVGPLYNATSCQSCHSRPVTGGGADLYRNFFVAVFGASQSTPVNLPGLPSPAVPAFGAVGQPLYTLQAGRMPLPTTVSGLPVFSSQRNSIPIFGVGLFEFIRNSTILANADPDDADGDGISGRANNDGAGMGRFGMKAQSNNVEFFTRAPLMNQMGITTDPFLGAGGTISSSDAHALPQGSATPNAPTRDNDGIPDPELAHDDLGDLIAFTRFLAPPQPKPFDAAATRGETLFGQVGCARCHIPSLESSRGPVRAFTDLLLHNMGSLADGVPFGRPQASSIEATHTAFEFRTPPLWGISNFAPYLHDGRAQTLEEAIVAHEGEGAAARDRFQALAAQQRDDILSFLRHL